MSANTLIALLCVIAAALAGLLYFFSQRFREKKQQEWRNQLPSEKVTEWGEWALGIAVLLTVICAIIITFAAR
jgi:ABC-type Fe3+ transport system permease subunit